MPQCQSCGSQDYCLNGLNVCPNYTPLETAAKPEEQQALQEAE